MTEAYVFLGSENELSPFDYDRNKLQILRLKYFTLTILTLLCYVMINYVISLQAFKSGARIYETDSDTYEEQQQKINEYYQNNVYSNIDTML